MQEDDASNMNDHRVEKPDELFDCMLAMREKMPQGTALSTMDIKEMKEELAHRG